MEAPFTVYITAQTLISYLESEEHRRSMIEHLRDARCKRVILEVFRDGLPLEEPLLQEFTSLFRSEGFEVLGGFMPTPGASGGKRAVGIETRIPCFCYSDLDTVSMLERELCKAARLFPQVVLGDAFLTSCRCPACIEACKGRAWGPFRRELLGQVAERWVKAAHVENPDVWLTIKFPQGYDRYARYGCDAERFPRIFDAVWAGTETRDPTTLTYGYVEEYQGYFNARWLQACAGDKFRGAWFDYLESNDQYFYEQGVTTYLAAPSEVAIYCYDPGVFTSSKIRRLADAAPRLIELRDAAREPSGVNVVKPPNTGGGRDLYIYDYLGMMSIPCVPVLALEPETKSAILPTHAFEDASVRAAIPGVIERGGQVIATANALRRLAQASWDDASPLLACFGYTPSGIGMLGAETRAFEMNGAVMPARIPFRAACDLEPDAAEVLVWAHIDPLGSAVDKIPFVTSHAHPSGGRAVVWNLGTFGEDAFVIQENLNPPVQPGILDLPHRVLAMLRNMATAPLGYSIDAPSRVASFCFEDYLVFVNYKLRPVEIAAKGLPWEPDSLSTDSPQTVVSGNTLLMAPRSHALVRRRAQ